MRPFPFIIASFIALFYFTAPPVPAASPLFLQSKTSTTVQQRQTLANPMVKRSRAVLVSITNLGTRDNPAATVELNLFTDTTYTAVFERSTRLDNGGFSWIGNLQGVSFGQAVFIVSGERLTGSISLPGANFSIRGIDGEIHLITEDDHSQYPEELPPISVPQPSGSVSQSAPDFAFDESCADITVLVAYTPEARIADGGMAAMEDRISLAIAETNQSYINSGLSQRISLVHTMETDPGDAANDFSTDLHALQNLSDGIFENVDSQRELHHADMVALIIDNTDYCGLGYLYSSATTAFSVTHYGCATGYYSFGHELGHNMGAHHDWYVNDTTYPDPTYNINKGYVNLADRWRTVMSYNNLCSANGVYCNRIQYWSNPQKSYGGDPMGVAYGGSDDCVKGQTSPDPSSCVADNRSVLNATCSTVANFRKTPGSSGESFSWLSFLPSLILK